ncbi:MAG: hypothetical protein IJT24_03740 [Lachnospiraceae bacterium]|nr:hypothetical protein [Lachnospiraceae bacterium]
MTIPKNAVGGEQAIATANILSTYKDSAKHVKTLAPRSISLDPKNVEAYVSSARSGRISITGLTGKSGSIRATLTYPGGVTKTVRIKVVRGK